MIESNRFAGIPLRTQTQRRRLVLLYYLFLLAFLIPGLIRGHALPWGLLVQTLTLGGLLGGIKAGGPVKPYTGSFDFSGTLDNSGVQQLNLSGNLRRSAFKALDEREQSERDHAHYLAYKILRWGLGISAVLYFLALDLARPWLERNSPFLLWMLLIIILSLPQSVILWTEPALDID